MADSFLIAGVDEVGRGPLAGPVLAAAVILNPAHPIAGLADSKALSETRRERLAEIGMAEADLQTVADKAATVLEWTKAPRPVTKEAFMQAMRDADAAGRALLAAEA